MEAPFNPWPIVSLIKCGGQPGDELTEIQLLQVQLAIQVDARRPITGYAVLETMVRCIGNEITLPDWLAEEFIARFRKVSNFETRGVDEAESFGPSPLPPGGHLKTAAVRARWGQLLELLFSGPAAAFPRTPKGREAAAKRFGLTPKQVLLMVPKTRVNKRGHKPYSAPQQGPRAHNPFNLAGRKDPNS